MKRRLGENRIERENCHWEMDGGERGNKGRKEEKWRT